MLPEIDEEVTAEEAIKRYIKATDKGILKVMSKMGISTYQSYCGAQIFDAVGLRPLRRRNISPAPQPGRRRRARGDRARRASRRHRPLLRRAGLCATCWRSAAIMPSASAARRMCGRRSVVADLQHAVRGNLPEKYRSFAKQINEQTERLLTLRGMFAHQDRRGDGRKPVRLEEVEPAKEIVKRFSTGAMSLRLDQPRGAYHARHRHEPHRRQVEHRRRRRRVRPLQTAPQWRLDALQDQASGLGPLRRDHRISHERRR